MKLRTQRSSAGSALTRVRCTTAPATTSKIRSAVRAASSGSVSGGARRAPGPVLCLPRPGTSAGPRSTPGCVRAGRRRGSTRRPPPSVRSWPRGGPGSPRTGGPRPRCRRPECPGRAAGVRRRARRPRRRRVRSCRPAAIEGRFRNPCPRRDVSQRELGPAEFDQGLPGGREDRGVRRGAAGASRGARDGSAALHPPTITGGSRGAVREITGYLYPGGTRHYYATARSETTGRGVGTRRRTARSRPAFTTLFIHTRGRGG